MYLKITNTDLRWVVIGLNGGRPLLGHLQVIVALRLGHQIGDTHLHHFFSFALDLQWLGFHVHYPQNAVDGVELTCPHVLDYLLLLVGLVVLVVVIFDVQKEFIVGHVGRDLLDVFKLNHTLYGVQTRNAFDVLDI